MSTVTATTAPDFRVLADVPRLEAEPGATLQLLVLAVGDSGSGQATAGGSRPGTECAGVELASGALVRAWAPAGGAPPRAYDLVEVVVAGDDEALPDPSQPEGLVCTAPPRPVGHLRGRRVERLLRPLHHPVDTPLLGLHGPAVRFWERRPDSPSIAVVAPRGPIELRREADYLACAFVWQGMRRELACLDRRLAAAMDCAGQRHWSTPKGVRVVVSLTPPIDGHCHKVVDAVLPKP
jgi:hypothetical protein